MKFELTTAAREYFYKITQIPHGSANEKALSDFIVRFAQRKNLEYVQDELYNVVIYKPATEGYENSAPLALQGHIDMVCEKNNDSNHNFETDPLDLYVDEENWLHANGTTLGADDGVAAAYMLALLDDDSVVHPALECIFTVQEEIGLIGAIGLDKNLIKSHRLISMDGGGEYTTSVSSSGGFRVDITRDLMRVENSKPTYSISIRGLLGGHSGVEIHLEKGNSNKLMARILKELADSNITYNLVDIHGGLKENAIPRECDALIASDSEEKDIIAAVNASSAKIHTELETSDNGFTCTIEKVETSATCFCPKCTKKVVDMMFIMPNGFQHKSLAIEGLTVTSLNMGVVEVVGDTLSVRYSIRSAINSATDDLYRTLDTIAKLFDATANPGARYPGWKFNPVSELREKFAKIVEEQIGKKLIEKATHGGLECGVFANYYDDMDLMNIGPMHKDIHTPKEILNLDSFDRTYQMLLALVADCK